MAIAVLGMAFAGQMNAQDDAKVIGGSGNKLAAGSSWTTFYDITVEGKRYVFCAFTATNCAPEVVVSP